MPKQLFELPWPHKGLVETTPNQAVPQGATTDCLNVRNFDSIEQRNRGGKRTGISKYVAQQIGGGAFIQGITDIVKAVAIDTPSQIPGLAATPPITNGYSQGVPIVVFPALGVATMADYSGNVSLWSYDAVSSSFPTQIMTITSGGGQYGLMQIPGRNAVYANLGDTLMYYTVSATVVVESITAGSSALTYSTWTSSLHPDGNWVAIPGNAGVDFVMFYPILTSSYDTTNGVTLIPKAGTYVTAVLFTPINNLFLCALSDSSFYIYQFDPATGATTLVNTTTTSAMVSQILCTSDNNYIYLSYNVPAQYTSHFFNGITLGSQIAVQSNINSLSGYADSSSIQAGDSRITNGAFVWEISSGVFGTQTATPAALLTSMTGIYRAGWITNNLIAANKTGPLHFIPATTNPAARTENLIVVGGGNIYRSDDTLDTFGVPNGGTSVLQASVRPGIVEAYQKVYFVDGKTSGYRVLDLAGNTVTVWTPTAGALPLGTTDTTLACQFGVLYRGRVVLSGLEEEPQNWFMSASGDPLNWDYAPATATATQAVAGNNSDAGELGDVLTALAPFQDDLMLMGGAKSLWIMRGDPAAGGQIDNVSRQTGIIGRTAWTFDNHGVFYFFGPNGLYRMAPGNSEPELVSRGRLDKSFAEFDPSNFEITLAYDNRWQGVHIFQTSLVQSAVPPMHYFWDQRNDAFWKDQYPSVLGPTAVHLFQSVQASKRGMLLGGFDGYLRHFDTTATSDDGTAINSYCKFTPLTPGSVFAAVRLDDIHIIMGKGSGATTFNMFAGSTVADARVATAPRFSRLLDAGGRTNAFRERIAQSAFIPEIAQTSATLTWAYEAGGGTKTVMSRIHGKGV